MKKVFALLLLAVMTLGMAACSGSSTVPTTTVSTTTGGTAVTIDETAAAEIRRAISLLLDRNYIVNQIAQGGQVPASSFVAMGMTDADGSQFYKNVDTSDDFDGYYNTSEDAYEANFAQAIETLKKYYNYDENTGKFTNFPTLTYLYNTDDNHKAIAEYLQNALSGIGITVNLENQEWKTFQNTRKNGSYSLARNGWVADYNDPICFLDMWTSDSGNNDIQFGRGNHAGAAIYSLDLTPYGLDIKVENGTWAETYDVLISAIKSCADTDDRYAMMHMAEDMLMDTGCIVPLYFYTDLYMIDDSVEGFFSNPLGYKFFHRTTVNGSGDSIAVCLASEPDTIDPALNAAVDGATLVSHLFSGLAKWDQDENGTPIVVADCAVTLPEGVVNEDGTVTYTYTLKDNLKWSDGQDVTAADFVFAWKRAASNALGANYGSLFNIIQGFGTEGEADCAAVNLAVEAVDDKTLVVTLNNPVSYWNELLAFPTFMPVREDVAANEGWATNASTFVSNGAYTMAGWEHDSVITLTKNNHYHGAADVTMDKIAFYLSSDENNMLANFKSGAWLMIDDVPTNEIANLKIQYPDEFKVVGQIGTYYVGWNINQDLTPVA